MTAPRIHFVASQVKPAGEAADVMKRRYGQCKLDEAEVIVALGGDGFMLRTLHRMIHRGLPVFGMKIGHVGFLMNRYSENELESILEDFISRNQKNLLSERFNFFMSKSQLAYLQSTAQSLEFR